MVPYTFSRFSNRVTSKFKVSAKIASSPPSLAWPIWSFLGLPLSICLSGVSLNALNPWFSSPADPPHPPPARSTRRARELVSLPLSVVLLERVSSHLLLYPRVLSRTQPFSGPPHTGLLSLACGAHRCLYSGVPSWSTLQSPDAGDSQLPWVCQSRE